MVFCKNRIHGCPSSFSSRYGMKIHLRSCANEARNGGQPGGVVCGQSTLLQMASDHQKDCDRPMISEPDDINIVSDQTNEWSELDDVKRLKSILDSNGCAPSTIVERRNTVGKNVHSLLKVKLGRIGRKASQKEVDSIITLLANPSFQLSTFISSCFSYKDCMTEEELMLQKSLHTVGFERHTITDPITEVSCDVYLRSTVDVLRNQIAGSSVTSCIFQPPTNPEDFGHPMMAEVGQKGVRAVSDAIMSANEKNTAWHNGITSFESSFVGLIQIYSDKSKTSLKESAFQFYPVHVTLMNFSEEHRRTCIMNGSTFLAFLPVSYYKEVDGNKYHAQIDRPLKLKLLHLAMGLILDDIRRLGYPGFSCQDKKEVRRRCHPCLVSYCCHLPESKDLSSVKNGNSIERNCHRCLAETNQFNMYTTSTMRTGNDTRRIIQEARRLRNDGKREEADTLMDNYSLVDQIPALIELPFFGLHSSLDMYFLFMYEPLHGFQLGISKQLKKCLSERLKSETLFTTGIPNKAGISTKRTFKYVRMAVLNGINRMLSHIQLKSPAMGLRIDFSSTGKGESGNGLYGDEGRLIGMLEARDYKSLDMVFPFVGMFTDRCCGESSVAVCTKVFVQYVDIMQMAMSYVGSPEWTEEKVETLEKKIESFKNDARNLFRNHQKSRLRTEKFHILDHIGQDIRRMGGILFGDAGLYEYTHTLVKTAYRSGSKRSRGAMDETILAFLKEMNHSSLYKLFEVDDGTLNDESRAAEFRGNLPQSEAVRTDCATLVQKGKLFSLAELQQCRSHVRKLRKAEQIGNETEMKRLKVILKSLNQTVLDLVKDVSEDGSRVLNRQILVAAKSSSTRFTSAEKFQMKKVMSGYVGGIETPIAKDYDDQLQMLNVQRSSIRYSQRIISGRGFYGSSSLRQDCVLLQANDENSSRIQLWVGKVLTMLRLPVSNQEYSEGEKGTGLDEYVFVQYFEVLPLQDEIDKALGCVRLRWGRDEPDVRKTQGTANIDPVRKWFDLLPVSSIRGVVHVIRGDYGLKGRGVTKDMEEVPWYDQSFYINRFYFNNNSRRYNCNA